MSIVGPIDTVYEAEEKQSHLILAAFWRTPGQSASLGDHISTAKLCDTKGADLMSYLTLKCSLW